MEIPTTPPPTTLPLDILGHIADTSAAYSRVLKNLSLTCKFMVPICRRHLFSNISFVNNYSNTEYWTPRHELFLSQPIILTHYVKNLKLILNNNEAFTPLEYDLLQKICDSSSLTSIQIQSTTYGKPEDWRKFPEKTKSLILSFLQISTIRHLTLAKISNFPAAAFSLCYGFHRIELHGISDLALPSVDETMQTIAAPVSSNLSENDTRSVLTNLTSQNKIGVVSLIIEFDRLKDAFFKIQTWAEIPQICNLLKTATCLQKLRIDVPQQVELTGIGSSLAANYNPQLRSITLNLDSFKFKHKFNNNDDDDNKNNNNNNNNNNNGDNDDSDDSDNDDSDDDDDDDDDEYIYEDKHISDGLNDELRWLSHNNVLELLEVEMAVQYDFEVCPKTYCMAWATDLDRMLTNTGAFPALRQVSIRMTWHIENEVVDYLGYWPEQLKSEHFPRLSKSRDWQKNVRALTVSEHLSTGLERKILHCIQMVEVLDNFEESRVGG